MHERGRFLYADPDGTVCLSLERGAKGVPIDSLLPPSLRGQAFDAVAGSEAVWQYFDLADMVLLAATDLSRLSQQIARTPSKASLPPFNLDFLKLRGPNGEIDAARLMELFTIIMAYWQNPETMAIEVGSVSHLWQRGWPATEIIAFIQAHTRRDPNTGAARLVFSEATPEQDLLAALLPVDIPFDQVTPATLEKLINWISWVPREHALKVSDIVFLGLADMTGKLDRDATNMAREYIWDRINQPPHFKALWRHIQAGKGLYPAHDPEADYESYSQRIAELCDQGADSLAIAKAVLRCAQTGLPVPTKPLCMAARLMWEQEQAGNYHDPLEARLNEETLDWFPPDRVTQTLRQLFQDRHYGESEVELDAWLADNGRPSTLRQLRSFFGRQSKLKILREFGLLDEQGQWSEVGFQRQQVLACEAQAKNISPSMEWMRWELHRRHRADQSVPLAWAFMDDRLSEVVCQRTRRLASVALSGGLLGTPVTVGETITPEQYQTLRQLGAWLTNDPATYAEQDDLSWLGCLARQQNVNWQNWEQICSFVHDKLDQPPNLDLIKDWQEGVVTFEGHGRYQAVAAEPFQDTKQIGRNEPCPCGSGKKSKKCCGR